MGRVYKLTIDNVSIGTAVQDIFSIKAPAGRGLILHSIHIESINTSPAALRMRLKRGTGTLAGSSGGSSVTPAAGRSDDQGDQLATYRTGDTTQETATNFYTLGAWNWDTVLPFDYLPPPEDRDDCNGGESLVFDLPATIVATTISLIATVEEK